MRTVDKVKAICTNIFGKSITFTEERQNCLTVHFRDGLRLPLQIYRRNSHFYHIGYAHYRNRLMSTPRETDYDHCVQRFREDVQWYVAEKRARRRRTA